VRPEAPDGGQLNAILRDADADCLVPCHLTVPREGQIVTLWTLKQADGYHGAGTWRLIEERMMEVTRSNGLEGVRLRLQRGVDEVWRGWTEPYSDGGAGCSDFRGPGK